MYALYIHGIGSGARSGTSGSLAHYMSQYEWLSPELPTDPFEALTLLRNYTEVFEPELIVGTSAGGLMTLFLQAQIKVAVNATYNIDTTLRRLGYGKHRYHCEREDGATEWRLDEPLVQAWKRLREETPVVAGKKMIALFSTDDEVVGREATKQNAKEMEQRGYEIAWSSKFGHRMNQSAAKQVVALIGKI